MLKFSRAASFAATSFCALATMGAFPSTQAVGAPLFAPLIIEPLPPEPALQVSPNDGVATDISPDQIPASDVLAIGSTDIRLRSNDAEMTLPNDAVIVQVGGTAPSELLSKFGVDVVTKFGEA